MLGFIIRIALVLAALYQLGDNAYAQYNSNQSKVWAFGEHQGLDFNSGSPVLISTSLRSSEGSAAVCDASGNLLFYTEGTFVWNKLGDTMPHGANIVPYYTFSACQSSVIAPVISNPEQYYIFSLEHYIGIGRLSYSVVDITLDGGLGDLVTGHTGIPMDTGLTEQMITVPGENCNIWLLVHDRYAAKFYSYEITSAGVSTTPVTSPVGFFDSCYATGAIKISHDRRLLACMNRSHTPDAPHRGELYDFDPVTGIVSNCRVFRIDYDFYGAEFSPDNTKLYTFSLSGKIHQYDVSFPDAMAIGMSEYEVVTYPLTGVGGKGGDMRLGPDGKIYFNGFSSHIDRINNPNLSGAACGYEAGVFGFAPEPGRWGICNHYWNTMPPSISGTSSICVGTEGALATAAEGGVWTSSNPAIAAILPDTGRVTAVAVGTATMTYSSACGESYFTVTVNPYPAAITGSGDTAICVGNSVLLTNSSTGGAWSSGDTTVATVNAGTGLLHASAAGTAIITYTSAAGCAVTDTIGIMDCTTLSALSLSADDLHIFPNPANDKLFITLPANKSGCTIEVVDATGKSIVREELQTGKACMDISMLPNGFYLLNVRMDGIAIHKRFQKHTAHQ